MDQGATDRATQLQPSGLPRRRSPGVWALLAIGYGLALVMAVGFIMVGAGMFGYVPRMEIRMVGYLGLLLILTLGPISVLIVRARGSVAGALDARLDDLAAQLRSLTELSALSGDARRIVHRRRERELLRKAIEEDMGAEDWDAAMVLVKELAERFGYRADAEEFRARIERARDDTVNRRVADAIAELDTLIVQRRWDVAMAQAARISRLYPDSPRVEGLRHRVEQARRMYKEDLERRFLHAAQEDSIDEAMELLKELDTYLTPLEGERLHEVARGVIGKARENLGARFKIAVQDRRWEAAADIGQRIIAEFPRTRMAQEVREMLDTIRERAQVARAAT